jgi:putative flippase GtrA
MQQRRYLLQLTKYLMVGFSLTLFDFLLFNYFMNTISILYSKVFSTSAAIVCGTFLNLKFTFRVKRLIKKVIMIYILIQLINLTANATLVAALSRVYTNENLIWIVATGFSTILTFTLLRRFLRDEIR